MVLAIAAMTVFATSCEKLKARDQLNKGVQAFKSAQYPQAVEHFKTAVEYDPTFATARLYLATAYMQQYIPGADSPDNNQMAKAAYDQFQQVLAQDPKNELAVASSPRCCSARRSWTRPNDWNQKLIALNPKSKEALLHAGCDCLDQGAGHGRGSQG